MSHSALSPPNSDSVISVLSPSLSLAQRMKCAWDSGFQHTDRVQSCTELNFARTSWIESCSLVWFRFKSRILASLESIAFDTSAASLGATFFGVVGMNGVCVPNVLGGVEASNPSACKRTRCDRKSKGPKKRWQER